MQAQQDTGISNASNAMEKLAKLANSKVDNLQRDGDSVTAYIRKNNGKKMTGLTLYRAAGVAGMQRWMGRGCYIVMIDGIQLTLGSSDSAGGVFAWVYSAP